MTAMLPLCFALLIPLVLCESTQHIASCTSCGPECESSCGSRNFRLCCYNYLKKRSSVPPLPLTSDLQQDSVQRSKFPWLSALLDGPSSSRNSPVPASDRDLQVQYILWPDWSSSDNLNHYQDYNSNYQETPPIGTIGLTETQSTEAPSARGSKDNTETTGENSAESNQGTREKDRGRGQNWRHQPYDWNSQNRHKERFPWSEVNRRLPVYGA